MTQSITARYSQNEELANALTHGLGAILSVAGLVILVTYAALAGDPWKVVSFSIYGASLIALYGASTLYHAARSPRAKAMWQMADHAAILLLIAGTYTPVTLVTLRGTWGWVLFGLVWGFAAAGLCLTLFFHGRFKGLKLAIYLAMGWLVLIAAKPMVDLMPGAGLFWLGLGGVLYTVGVPFYIWKRLPFNHAIWHLFVLAGSLCQFLCVLWYILPR